jgi:hypothetical protein
MSGKNLIKVKREMRESMEVAQKDYNSNLTQLIRIAKTKNPQNLDLETIQTALSSVIKVDATLLIKETGHYIWKFRENISRRDENFFLTGDFSEEINSGLGATNKDTKFTGDDVDRIMKSLRTTYRTMTKPEQDVVWKHTTSILVAYAQYLKAEKTIRKIESDINNL